MEKQSQNFLLKEEEFWQIPAEFQICVNTTTKTNRKNSLYLLSYLFFRIQKGKIPY